jgi:hypothetical protein
VVLLTLKATRVPDDYRFVFNDQAEVSNKEKSEKWDESGSELQFLEFSYPANPFLPPKRPTARPLLRQIYPFVTAL